MGPTFAHRRRDALCILRAARLLVTMATCGALLVIVASPRAADAADADDAAVSVGTPTDQAAAIELHGDRQQRFHFAAVYRRYDRLAVRIDRLDAWARDARRVRVTLDRVPPLGEPKTKRVVLDAPMDDLAETGSHLQGETSLGDARQRLSVGRYRVRVWLDDDQQEAHAIGGKPLFLIFNAHHPLDRETFKPEAEYWLGSTHNLVQLVGGQLQVNLWSLDIHDPEVFALAMSLADGATTSIEGAERMLVGVFMHVDGHWPQLSDTTGRIPADSPESESDWYAGGINSAAQRLRSHDARGQCFDYALLYVALLRSAGVPARTVTSIDPAPMPHPDAPRRLVQWDYHVWAEVFLAGHWWASDVTYLDPPLLDRLPSEQYPGLQMPHDLWFARAIGPRTQLWAVERGVLRDVSRRYGLLQTNKARQITQPRVSR